jgi:heat shock protein HslJ
MTRAVLGSIVVIALATLSGCSQPGSEPSPSPSGPSSLAGTSWRAVSVAGGAPVVGREPTLAFTSESEMNGNTGCNGYFGGYTYADGTISFSEIGMTLMACDDAVGKVETAYTQALNAATTVAIDDGGQLLLSGPAGDLLFRADSLSAR